MMMTVSGPMAGPAIRLAIDPRSRRQRTGACPTAGGIIPRSSNHVNLHRASTAGSGLRLPAGLDLSQ